MICLRQLRKAARSAVRSSLDKLERPEMILSLMDILTRIEPLSWWQLIMEKQNVFGY